MQAGQHDCPGCAVVFAIAFGPLPSSFWPTAAVPGGHNAGPPGGGNVGTMANTRVTPTVRGLR